MSSSQDTPEDAPQKKPGDAPQKNSPKKKQDQTLLEQMGGLSGLFSSTLPVLVLVPINSKWGLTPALIAAVGTALAIFVWRLVRKESLQPAVSGLLGVAFCAAIAWFMGDAKGYFAYGIWYSLVAGCAFVISVVVRWPLVGVIWRGINGEDQRWRTNRRAVKAFNIATLSWAVIFLARFGVQQWLYSSASASALGYTRIAMGWPLTAVVLLVTVWAVKTANRAEGKDLKLLSTTKSSQESQRESQGEHQPEHHAAAAQPEHNTSANTTAAQHESQHGRPHDTKQHTHHDEAQQ